MGKENQWFMGMCNAFIHKSVDSKYQHLSYPGLFTFR